MQQASTVRHLLIADDDPIARDLIRHILRRYAATEIVGEATDGLETLKLVQRDRPDILLLDILMPNLRGPDVLNKIVTGFVNVAVVVLAASITKQQALEALQLGARGILPKKSVRRLPECLSCILRGEYWIDDHAFRNLQDAVLSLICQPESSVRSDVWRLTAREMQVMSLVMVGKTNRDIASTLSISEKTVKRHLANIFEKCGTVNRVGLARFASEHGLLASAVTSSR